MVYDIRVVSYRNITTQTCESQELFLRALELIESFAQMGFDQDQAMMRQALFEAIMFSQLKVNQRPMYEYCRFGWKCDLNNCKRCKIIHQRRCNNEGVQVRLYRDQSNCSMRLEAAFKRVSIYSSKNAYAKNKNKFRQDLIIKKYENMTTYNAV